MRKLKDKVLPIIIGCIYGLFGLSLIGMSNSLLAGNEYNFFIVVMLFIIGSVFIIAAFVRMKITKENKISEFDYINLILKISITIIGLIVVITFVESVIIILL